MNRKLWIVACIVGIGAGLCLVMGGIDGHAEGTKSKPAAGKTRHLLCTGPPKFLTERWFFYGGWRSSLGLVFAPHEIVMPEVNIYRRGGQLRADCSSLKMPSSSQSMPSARETKLVSRMFGEVLPKLRRMGFSSPLGWKPLEKDTGAMWVVVRPKLKGALGAMVPQKVTCDRRLRPSVSVYMELAGETFRAQDRALSSIVLRHELFHAIQFTNYFTGFCGGAPQEGQKVLALLSDFKTSHEDFREMMWFMESTADTVGHVGIPKPSTAKERKELQGWIRDRLFRNYYRLPLHLYRGFMDKQAQPMEIRLAAYQAQHFWHHLARTYYRHLPEVKRYAFLEAIMKQRYQRVMASPKLNAGRPVPTYHPWLTEIHQHALRAFRLPLSHVYATFVAAVASRFHGVAKRSQILRDFALPLSLFGEFNDNQFKALQLLGRLKTFDLCERVELSASSSQATVRIPLSMWTAKCVLVVVTGFKSGHKQPVVSVKIAATGASTKALDQLHLAVASTTDQSQFNCEQSLDKMATKRGQKATHKGRRKGSRHYLDNCLMAPMKTFRASRRGEQAKRRLFQRVWAAFPQRPRQGKSRFETLYVLSRSPVPQKLQKIAQALPKARGRDAAVELSKRRKIGLILTLNAASSEHKTRGKAALSQHSLSVARINPLIQHGDDLIDVPLDDPSQAPLLPQQNILQAFSGLRVNQLIKDGMRRAKHGEMMSLTWHTASAKRPERHIGDLELKRHSEYTFFPTAPIAFGQTGVVKGVLVGRRFAPSQAHLVEISRPTEKTMLYATLSIQAFTRQMLRASLVGPLCQINMNRTRIRSLKDLCQRISTYRATISKPFPALYLPKTIVKTTTTPGWREYQRYQLVPLRGGVPSRSASAGKTRSASGTSGAKPGCVCEGIEQRLQALALAMMKGPGAQSKMKALVQCQIKCAMKGRKSSK